MPVSAPALVRPRCFDPDTGDIVLLEDEVLEFLQRHPRGAIEILGGMGAGKSTALDYLRGTLSPLLGLQFLDDGKLEAVAVLAAEGPVICTISTYQAEFCLRLAPWGDDELIEFLTAAHPQACASVMQRVRSAADRLDLEGIPELWVMAIDEMVTDSSLISAKLAVRRALDPHLTDPRILDLAGCYAWAVEIDSRALRKEQWDKLHGAGASDELRRALRFTLVQMLLAADHLTQALIEDRKPVFMSVTWPRDLIAEVASRIAGKSAVLDRLLSIVRGKALRQFQPMAASLLHACGRLAHARIPQRPFLGGAFLEGIVWKGVNLTRAQLDRTDLNGADLSTAQLDQARACGVQLTGACLREASLWSIDASGSNLREADLSGANARDAALAGADLSRARMERTVLTNANLRQANLTAAICRGADFSRAELEDATIDEADFSGVRFDSANLSRLPLYKAALTDARFVAACLRRCDLEGVDLPQAHFERATLADANLTGSRMPAANFAGADLRGAYLADISWERSILQDADLRDVTFHMGSSRSGLLFTPLASEGTRTGFYTDDYEEQYFKRPEEIRKANLRGADLRGARIDNVDFYLVDLRDALYDAKQAEHFRRCRAILLD